MRAEPRILPLLAAPLRARPGRLLALVLWSLVEAVPALLAGQLVARAVDDGFAAGRPLTGLGWLALMGLGVFAGAWGTRQAYPLLAAVVEPFRDDLVRTVAEGSLRQAVAGRAVDASGVSRLTLQVEMVREAYAGVLMVVRGFLLTVGGALLGMLFLAPLILLLVVPPLLAGIGLFLMLLRRMAGAQRDAIVADERVAEAAGAATAADRDIVACGAEDGVRADLVTHIDAQAAAARRLAALMPARVLCLAVAGWLPLLLLLVAAPGLRAEGLSAGAVLGAATYVTGGLQPAVRSLIQGLGGSGLRLVVALRRIHEAYPSGGGVAGGWGSGAPRGTGDSAWDAGAGVAASVRGGGAVAVASACGDGSGAVASASGDGAAAVAAAHDVEPAVIATAYEAEPAVIATAHDVGPAVIATAYDVELTAVTFAYGPQADPVFRDLDLTLPEGGHLAVVGPSGIGKSTLAGLIGGTLEPDSGLVRLGGRRPGALPPAALSALRVLVPQEAYVFSGDLAENLRYLRPDASDEDVRAAVEAVGAGSLVSRLGGIGTVIDPAALSSGERQQIALVRAYLSPAPLVLLDEATCHLDPAAEARAEEAFVRRPGSLLVIAHRISSALRARQVLVLDGGTVVSGAHEEVLEQSVLYRDLVGHWSGDGLVPRTGPDEADAMARRGVRASPPRSRS
ncbi:ATP-binding cassette domain-containing protein [Streptomyces sp. D2-8]|uniref:ATP-binding cassette domain-containing protein n=1 Tax=Streptomyces sp. D2-8 TaxID=2707767 RepID=UPI0020BE31D4|nr:ATP-binding cassette domain-containing protein [Streptomyces sp. D2-8]MCK8431570.1 ATP-binding cassette domain-containing protein [Streptomyces sp. D2-8]